MDIQSPPSRPFSYLNHTTSQFPNFPTGLEVNQGGIEVDNRGGEDHGGKQVACNSAPERDPTATGKEAYNASGLLQDEVKQGTGADLTDTKVNSPKNVGVRRRKYLIRCVLLLAIIIGIAVGVGVGESVGHRNGSAVAAESTQPSKVIPSSTGTTSSPTASSPGASSSTTPTAPLTSTPLSPTATTGISTNECPASNGSTYSPGLGYDFQKFCGIDWPIREKTASGDAAVNDVAVRIAYSIDSCIDACYQHSLSSNNQSACAGVTYNANLTRSLAGHSGNCFLKSAIGVNVNSGDLVESAARLDSLAT